MRLPGRAGGHASLLGICVLILAGISAGMLSCTPIASVAVVSEKSPPRIWGPGELLESLAQRAEQFRSVRALADVHYRGTDGSRGFKEAILVQRPDRMRLETLSYWGTILVVTVDADEIVGFHPRDGLLYRGRSSRENLFRYTQIPLSLSEITALLLGLPPVEIRVHWQAESNSLSRSREDGSKEVVTFGSEIAVPIQWQRFGPDGKLELSAQFLDYLPTSPGLFPLKIIVEAHAQQKRLELRYEAPELNVNLPLALFIQEKPADVREISLESLGG